MGTACFAFLPKLRLDYVVYEFNCLFVYLFASKCSVFLMLAVADFILVLRTNSNYLAISFGNTYSQLY